MTYDEYLASVEALRDIQIDPNDEQVNFVCGDGSFRGKIRNSFGVKENLVLLLDCWDPHDTSGAGHDFVAVPLSQVVAIYHNAQKHRYERSK